jgi:S-adenosyl methyltransferase
VVFARAVVPGSYLIISAGGLELVPPGVVSVRGWSGGGPARHRKPLTAAFVAGVAREQ